jgi:perosamine synthetase
MIPLSVPYMGGNELAYVKECIYTGWVSSVGSYVTAFEKKCSDYLDVPFAVAVVNGTAALHLSLLACGVEPNDEILVPTLTFVATANTVTYCNAVPFFLDVDAETMCLDVSKLKVFIETQTVKRQDGFSYNKKTNRRIKAIIPVHVFGHPVDIDPMQKICEAANIDIIEDATESLGSLYKGKKTGCFGRCACFSFNGNKIITTGGGGIVVTSDRELAYKIKHLSTQAKSSPLEYDHDMVGYNYRMCNVNAAIGVAQMELLDSFIKIKRRNLEVYRSLLADFPGIKLFQEQEWAQSNSWFYTVQVPRAKKQFVLNALMNAGIQARPIWKLLHTLPMYADCQCDDISVACVIYDTCLNLPCSVTLTESDIVRVTDRLKESLSTL